MKVVIIVQARMLSDRLPGKILKKVNEKPLLGYQMESLARVTNADQVVVATGESAEDDPVVSFCEAYDIPYHRGSNDDVLKRFHETAKQFEADVIVRCCADCPLIDAEIVQKLIDYFLVNCPKYDYVSNILERSYPRGMDTEVFTFKALDRAFKDATLRPEREHVTYYLYTHPEIFNLAHVKHNHDLSYHRWCVDTAEDFELIERILNALKERHQNPSLDSILELFKEHPDWIHINRHVQQKPV